MYYYIIYTLCDAMQSVVDNYEAVLLCLEQITEEDRGEAGSKASGLASTFLKFETFFGLKLGVLVFKRAEELSKLLQKQTLTASAAKVAAQTLISSLQNMRNKEYFHTLWVTITQAADDLNLEKPQVQRCRRPPKRFDSGSAPVAHDVPENLYRITFFQFLDCSINFVRDRFDQRSFDIYMLAEKLLLQCATSESWASETEDCFKSVTDHFGSDLDVSRLEIQLKMLTSAFKCDGKSTVKYHSQQDVINALIQLGDARKMFAEINKLVRLLLTIPVSSATAERCFSALRRLKSYTRSTMSAARLNHVAVKHT